MDEQTNTQPTNDPNDAANLRELALALIAARYPDATDTNPPELAPGQLPPGFVENMAVPSGWRIIGSLIAARPVAVLATTQSPDDAFDTYTEQLTAAGWTAAYDRPPRHGGFQHSGGFGMPFRHGGRFYRDGSPTLNVMIYTQPSGETLLHIAQAPDEMPVSQRGPRGGRIHYDIFSMLPAIVAPPGAVQDEQGGSGSSDRVHTSARVVTDLDLPALSTHYTNQLEQAGWQQGESGENDPVTWSTWTFADDQQEPWRAFFVVLKRPEEQRLYWVHLIAEWTGKPSSQAAGGAEATHGALIGWQSHGQLSGS